MQSFWRLGVIFYYNHFTFNYFQDDSEDSDKSDSEEELHDNTGVKEADFKSGKVSDESDDESHYIEPTPPPKKKPAPAKKKIVAKSFDSDSDSDKPNGNGNGHAINGGDSDSDDEPVKKKPAAKKAPKKLTSNDDLFDSMISNGDKKPAPKKKPAKKKIVSDDDGSGSDFDSKPKKGGAKKTAAKKPAAKKPKYDSDSEDFNMDDVAPARDRPGRGKKTVNYGGSGSDSDSDFVWRILAFFPERLCDWSYLSISTSINIELRVVYILLKKKVFIHFMNHVLLHVTCLYLDIRKWNTTKT